MEQTRRDFLKLALAGTASAVIGSPAKSYSRIMGANERLNFAIIGLHGRGYAHMDSVRSIPNARITHIADVDRRELDKFALALANAGGEPAEPQQDFRRILADKEVDVVTIATPEHWQTPMAIMALQTGKHVYLEKPGSHNPHEVDLLVQAQRQYGRLVQLGNQMRSLPHVQEIVQRIHSGLIGRTYYAKGWYTNTRKSIGVGQPAPVPAGLDWDLWQGPAPRRPYRDNIHPYNWHWFWHWGTGETLNNGTHEIDLCRWALNAGLPEKISASGGRFHYRDDWEFYDTLVVNFSYPDRLISWESLSCQGKQPYGRSRGVTIHGDNGTVMIDRDGFWVFDPADKQIEEHRIGSGSSTQDLLSRDAGTNNHFQNLAAAIREGTPQNSPIATISPAVTMLLTANIAWKLGATLDIDPASGDIRHNKKAGAMRRRRYEKGWEPKV